MNICSFKFQLSSSLDRFCFVLSREEKKAEIKSQKCGCGEKNCVKTEENKENKKSFSLRVLSPNRQQKCQNNLKIYSQHDKLIKHCYGE